MTEMVKEKLDLKCSKNYYLAKFIPACEFPTVEKCHWNAHLQVQVKRSLQASHKVRKSFSRLKAVKSSRLLKQHKWESNTCLGIRRNIRENKAESILSRGGHLCLKSKLQSKGCQWSITKTFQILSGDREENCECSKEMFSVKITFI